jgi:beta-lactam-binding protein with PASTA domain
VRRRRVPADDETVVAPAGEWPVAEERVAAGPPVPPPDAGPPPPQGPPPGWLAVENPWPWLALVLVAVAALLIWLFAIRNHSDKATVPRVVGLSQPVAIKTLNDKGFDVTAVRRPGKTPAGIVFAQKPGAGSQLKKKQTVEIDVSNGVAPKPSAQPGTTTQAQPTTTTAAPQVTVPDFTGKAQAEAGAAAETAGLVPDTYPVTGSQPSGTVVSQDPAAGSKLAAGKSLKLNVSTGGGNQPNVTVPNVVGAKAADARAKLWAAKLTARTIYAQGTTGVVLSEQPTGGGQAPAFTQITLTVGR